MNTMIHTRYIIAILVAVCCLPILQGCEPYATVSGVVVNTQGETLPGVGVVVRGTNIQAVSNGVGRYTLRIAPGALTLDMAKTGYTPAVLEVDATGAATLEADTVMMWPLPPRKGVFLFEGHRYHECTHADPRRYMRIEKQGDKETVLDSPPLFATKRLPDTKAGTNFYEIGALGNTPMLIAHKLPPYDVELQRLELTEAAIFVPRVNRGASASNADLPRDTVWAPAETIPVFPVPVDQPGRMLLDLRPAQPLSPGIYAVHWGSFSGYDTIDARIFLFEVLDLEEDAEPERETEEEDEENGGN